MRHIVIGLGELLWDLLPDGPRLGGAPANFAFHARRLGDEGLVASRVGDDEAGEHARRLLEERGLGGSLVQVDPGRPTGTVRVELDESGSPTFEIVEDVAWDRLELTPDLLELAGRAHAVCFGTLAQRTAAARLTIHGFLDATPARCLRVYDVNLRQRFYDGPRIEASLRRATVVKLNHEEHPVVARLTGLDEEDAEAFCRGLLERFGVRRVCLTRGGGGALLVGAEGAAEHPGFPVEVVDTVGSGDAFTAAMVYHLLRGSDPETALRAANRLGSAVATRSGATPALEEEALEAVRAGR